MNRKAVNNRLNNIKAKTFTKSIEMNSYVRPDERKWYYNVDQYILNGEKNGYWRYIEDRYYGSPTNAAIINDITSYLIADGLKSNGLDIKNILSDEDLDEIGFDFKLFGQAYISVIYDYNRKVAKIEWVSTKRIGIYNNLDLMEEPDYYWWCFDWRDQFKFTPQMVARFGKEYSLNELFTEEELRITPFPTLEEINKRKPKREILAIRRDMREPFFSQPDYLSCLQLCEAEEEFSNSIINGIHNGFSPEYLLNIFGVEPTAEAQAKFFDAFRRNWTGTNKTGTVVPVFNDDGQTPTTIESVPQVDKSSMYEFVTGISEKMIFKAHRYYPILLGQDQSTGFSNDAQEMITAERMQYRKVINKMRKQLTNAFEKVLKINDPNVELEFQDFPEFKGTTEAVVTEENTNTPIV